MIFGHPILIYTLREIKNKENKIINELRNKKIKKNIRWILKLCGCQKKSLVFFL